MGKGHVYTAKVLNKDGSIIYDEQEHETWSILYKRQVELVKPRACEQYLKGIELLNFGPDQIPDYREVNKNLNTLTGWGVKPVPALIPADEFFDLLANKKFPVASFIRVPEELDYLEEPDLFHEFFGHCPLLTNKDYCGFMEKFGKLGQKLKGKERMRLFRLFWFTIEFGLIKSQNTHLIYGGGILSSKGETVYSLEPGPIIKELEIIDCLRTPFRIDIMQPLYFSISSFNSLFKLLDGDINAAIKQAIELGDHEALFEKKGKIESQSMSSC